MTGRVLTPELMDDPAIDERSHRLALAGLSRLNAISRAAHPIVQAIQSAVPPGEVHIVDVATGGGDVASRVMRMLERRGYEPRWTLCDVSDLALRIAQSNPGLKGSRVCQLDVLRDELPRGDVLMCSLFLHHLETGDVSTVLGAMSRAASRLVVVSDLRRSRVGTMLAGVIPRLVTRSDVVHVDALKSARAALTCAELAQSAARAGLEDVRIEPIIPSRMLLTWERGA